MTNHPNQKNQIKESYFSFKYSQEKFTMTQRNRKYEKIYIYGLKDPFTDEIRYIGKSVRPKERLTNHCNDKSKNHRTNWISSLMQKGKRPILVILEEMSIDSDWQERERFWIAYAKSIEWNLVNGTSGGDGVKDLCQEAKEKMLKTWTGRKHKPESIIKIGRASKGRKHSEKSKQYMKNIMTGREFTPEWKERISKAVRKLSDKDISDILSMLDSGYKVQELAKIYKVHRTTISKVKAGTYP